MYQGEPKFDSEPYRQWSWQIYASYYTASYLP